MTVTAAAERDERPILRRVAELRRERGGVDVQDVASVANDDGTVGRRVRDEPLTEHRRLRSSTPTCAPARRSSRVRRGLVREPLHGERERSVGEDVPARRRASSSAPVSVTSTGRGAEARRQLRLRVRCCRTRAREAAGRRASVGVVSERRRVARGERRAPTAAPTIVMATRLRPMRKQPIVAGEGRGLASAGCAATRWAEGRRAQWPASRSTIGAIASTLSSLQT